MKRLAFVAVAALAGCFLASSASAETPQPEQQPRVQRRAQKLSQSASQNRRVQRIEGVVVKGRPGAPQAVIEVQRQEPRFDVGTARYSPRARPFLQRNKRQF